ncbi:MAG TPA: BREX-1 system adenine-specific DNA-methyltransferase PglX [Amaricoccus sp.]|uniref:BREX-1 system adenine-specific DNA-methyltransferase PglX n=1 Tax=Amaricoccus sp. TaxID=1872485 RepID=UPI00262ED574|nr:BREX-1 system adenine-specific DNA-methyltransferase PglX [Amaricoccus sp.]HMR54434.1 BREX-1 system adenine-specific DNA-methyltransferase PglX [Amaricoccus sp.]HMU01443.1 BREX-1 system adenine-specific DNA-methyltransferase PglX [Amaricoccus sp.]
MAFDQPTRNRLQRFVTEARATLEEEFTRQLQNDYGMDPASGTVAPLASLRHIDDQQRETARILRDTLAHYCAGADTDTKAGLDRIVREQAFTVLNRLAALRMAEARGLLIESVGNGYQAKGFQLYARLAGTGLGETGDAYRVYLQSVFDELSQDLPGLFDRFSPQGRLFPREAALIQVLTLINHGEIEPLWAEDETIGWIYQYFNSKEERKAMRDASQAPRNSRELAVRNQFFTPRYVVEFLVDNTLGRLWFNWTGGQTGLRDRCQYLLVKPDEQPDPAKRLRDPRTIKLLDPACGSMHFGLYAFDLFLEIYREAWDWEQTHGPGCLDTETGGSADLKPLSQTYADQDAFLHDVPRLIIEHNIYGVDIDPRAAQIASLALWLRAQRAWHDVGVKAKDRPQVGRGHVVAAVAPPAEVDLRKRFMEELDPLDAELFEKTLFLLKDLPELGVLLKVEKDLPTLMRKVFGTIGDLLNTRSRGTTWQQIEIRLREALSEFGRAARATYQGRLFAEDALQSLRMIDLSREQFDAIVMNPPFGALSAGSKEPLVRSYKNSKGDLLAIFVERSLELLRNQGKLGAITSRAPFFLSSMENWRTEVVFKQGLPEIFADLGMGVMDDAMVEAASYVIEKNTNKDSGKLKCLRALTAQDKGPALLDIARSKESDAYFEIAISALRMSPSSSFAYWIKEKTLAHLSKLPSVDPEIVSIRVGMQTGNDWRFLRQWWEVQPSNLIGVDDSGNPQKEYEAKGEKWITYTKTDKASPWFSPLLQVAKWESSGQEYDYFLGPNGKSRARLQNREVYFQPGFSYMLRSARIVPYIVPTGAIPTAGRAQGFGEGNNLLSGLAIAASNIGSSWARLTGEKFEWPKFQAGMVQSIPAAKLSKSFLERFEKRISEIYAERRSYFERREPYREFIAPEFFFDNPVAHEWSRNSLIGNDLDEALADEYGLERSEFMQLQKDLQEAISFQESGDTDAANDEHVDEVSETFSEPTVSEKERFEGLVSYAIGACFGRWDVRNVLDGKNFEGDHDPFKPLPKSPPGALSSTNAADLNQQGYPLRIQEAGIMDSAATGPSQLPSKIRECFDLLSEARPIDEEEICECLGVSDINIYLNRPSGFFATHLDMYTAGGRKAPIYWPLSTSSGSYTLWLYYPSLTSQTLYTAVNDFVEPKLKQVGRDAATLRDKGAARSRDDEKAYEALQAFELELIELRDTLLLIAPTYRPNHDDGVQITAAPLWQLFRHKPWQKILKDTWAKLEKGDYDWAHLAMAYWPDRVREKCKADKSLAIAHDLENLYVEPEAQPKKARKMRGDA